MYNPNVGRWNGVDALAEKYFAWSPYNYVMNSPLIFFDPDGRRVVSYDEETQEIILGYITDQLGENHGFSFNKRGELRYKKKSLSKAKAGFNDEQILIADGLVEVADNQQNVIEVHINEDSHDFEVSIYEPGFKLDGEGKFVTDEQGLPVREGWEKTNLVADLNTQNTGGALFWQQGKLDKTDQNYAHIAINKKAVSSLSIKAEGDQLTFPSESSVYIHEILDHGLDFVHNGNVDKSEGPGVENVKYHNAALKNISNGKSPLRINHHDGK